MSAPSSVRSVAAKVQFEDAIRSEKEPVHHAQPPADDLLEGADLRNSRHSATRSDACHAARARCCVARPPERAASAAVRLHVKTGRPNHSPSRRALFSQIVGLLGCRLRPIPVRSSMALTVFEMPFPERLCRLSRARPSARPLRFLPSRTTTASTSVVLVGPPHEGVEHCPERPPQKCWNRGLMTTPVQSDQS